MINLPGDFMNRGKNWFVVRFASCLCILGFAAAANGALVTNVFESWEGLPRQNPFSGTGNVTWTGDLSAYAITNHTWPSTVNFAISNSLRHVVTNAASPDTILTAFSFDPNRPTMWSVFVSGNGSDNITANNWFDMILVSSTNDPALVEAGTMTGYRLRLTTRTGTTDSLLLEKANGTVWSTLGFVDFGVTAGINQGWNIQAFRESDGSWRFGFANGAIGTPVPLVGSVIDASILAGTSSGMGYIGPAGQATAFGFDNFLITSIPEPSPMLFAFLAFALCFVVRHSRNRSVTHS